eukprot:TRINITY_DN702_c0_g2_i1.p1 TRINITY_DN702_c0_g2~~TRINITY_DN702_c0_g2_i1.p1  ORF type:complete len:217 (+),score=51.39 TRINITY_DN702_c0_g2_i1:118-768(+)
MYVLLNVNCDKSLKEQFSSRESLDLEIVSYNPFPYTTIVSSNRRAEDARSHAEELLMMMRGIKDEFKLQIENMISLKHGRELQGSPLVWFDRSISQLEELVKFLKLSFYNKELPKNLEDNVIKLLNTLYKCRKGFVNQHITGLKTLPNIHSELRMALGKENEVWANMEDESMKASNVQVCDYSGHYNLERHVKNSIEKGQGISTIRCPNVPFDWTW